MKCCLKFVFLLVVSMVFESTDEFSLSVGSLTVHTDWSQLYPKTKWCANGYSTADNSLGEDECTDACCKVHAECSLKINPGETLNSLRNDNKYITVSCDCETAFRQCLLKNINESKNEDSSRGVGHLYFTLVGMDCAKEDHKIVKCLSETTVPKRCKQYELDMTSPKLYQWFDVLAFDLE